MTRALLIALVLLCPAVADAMEPPPRAGREYPVDGAQVGQPFAEVRAREAYGEPCSVAPAGPRRVALYGAKGCKRAFSADTSAVFLLEGEGAKQTVGAIAWLGGSWFDNRSNFPVNLRTPLPDEDPRTLAGAIELPATATLKLGEGADGLRVTRFGEDIYIIDDGGRVVGIVVGVMPGDGKSPQWAALLGAWLRHTR